MKSNTSDHQFSNDYVEEVKKQLESLGTIEHDNQGQMLVYSGMFLWQDGTYHSTAEKVIEE